MDACRAWETILEALNEGAAELDAPSDRLQMIDSTVVRAHQHAAGARGDSAAGYWALKRWLDDQDPPPSERMGPTDADRRDGGPDLRPQGF